MLGNKLSMKGRPDVGFNRKGPRLPQVMLKTSPTRSQNYKGRKVEDFELEYA
jgi:hypothetical protein